MRKGPAWVLCLVCVVAVGGSAWGGDLDRLHPILRALLAQAGTQGSLRNESLADSPAGIGGLPFDLSGFDFGGTVAICGDQFGVLVKTYVPFFGSTFLGLPVDLSTGTVLTMRVTLQALSLLAASPDVVYVEPAWRTEPKLDRSLPAIGADVVHNRVPPNLGTGVIVGTVDTGVDYTHLDFRVDEDGDGYEETSRILYLWDQTAGSLGGRYTEDDIEADLRQGGSRDGHRVNESDTDGHGTHVLSVAAGDGSSSSLGLVGVAPQAKLVVVKTTFYTSDILAGVQYIFDRAAGLGLPAVVNLSLGGQNGPHDGTSLFEQGLDELAQGVGRAIVVSAGNEGNETIHVSGTLHGDSSTFSVAPRSGTLDLDLWYPGGSRFTLRVFPPTGTPIEVPAGTSTSTFTASGTVFVDNASGGPNPNNGDREIVITVRGVTLAEAWTFTVEDTGGGGRFDGWLTSSSTREIVGGDATSTIDEPGNAPDVITVGSFNTKGTWTSRSGEQDFSAEYPVGALSSFSSRGPTRDGRQKPDLAAPGAWVAAARSASSTPPDYLLLPDGEHTILAGTSVSAPHVSGVVALLFSADPQLTGQQAKQRLMETARADAYTGAVPNDRWGAGKLAADAAVEPTPPPPSDGGKALTVTLAENPVATKATFTYSVPAGVQGAALRVYDAFGRLVFEAALSAGEGSYDWDLEDQWGDRLASGLYLYVLVSDSGRSAVGRLVIAR